MPGMHYIAETDANCQVSAIWVKPESAKSAKVFDPLADRFDLSGRVTFSGASEAEIRQWVAV